MSNGENGTKPRIEASNRDGLWDPSRSYATHQPSRIGNPGALGLFSFGATAFILSMVNVQAASVVVPNVIVGVAVFGGGLVQILAGMWEFPRGNVFGGTVFSLYGAFWLSYATILIPGSGIVAAYGTNVDEFHHALGIYLITWFIVVTLMTIAALRKNIVFIALLADAAITFLLLALANFKGNAQLTKAGGVFGIIAALLSWYCAVSELLIYEESYFMLPLGVLPKRGPARV